MEIPSEVQVALAAFVAVLAANALKWASRFITNYVRGTPNKLDDKIWAAVRDAIDQDRDEQVDSVSEIQKVASAGEPLIHVPKDQD